MWVLKEELLETIKRTLFDTGIISSDRLDPADIATLNKSSFDDGTWFCLVKRAAAEWQFDRDYQKQPRQEAEELPEPKSTPKSTDKQSDKQERSIELKVSKIDGPPTIELAKLTWTLEMLIRQLKLPMRDVRFTDLKGNDRRQIWVRVPGGYGHSTIPVRFDQGSQDLIVGPMDLLPVFVDPALFFSTGLWINEDYHTNPISSLYRSYETSIDDMAGDNNGVKYEFRVSLRTTESTLKFTDACVSGHPPMQWLVRDPAGVQGHDKLMRRKVFMLIDLTEV